MSDFKERVNYVIDNGWYCAHCVNIPVVVQAKTFDEMKRKVKILAGSWVKMMQETVDNNDFEYIPET